MTGENHLPYKTKKVQQTLIQLQSISNHNPQQNIIQTLPFLTSRNEKYNFNLDLAIHHCNRFKHNNTVLLHSAISANSKAPQRSSKTNSNTTPAILSSKTLCTIFSACHTANSPKHTRATPKPRIRKIRIIEELFYVSGAY